MLEELKNIRSYNDLIKAINLIKVDLDESKETLSKLISVSARGDMVIGLDSNKSMLKPQIDTVLLPSKDSIADISEIAETLSKLHGTIENFRVARYIAERDYGNIKTQAKLIQSLDETLVEAEKQIASASKKMSEYAMNHLPVRLKQMFKIVRLYLDERITPDMYSRQTRNANIFPTKVKGKDSLLITMNLRYTNLKLRPDVTNKSGMVKNFAYKTFVVVLTASIDVASQKATYYITAMPEFKLPGTYPVGNPVSEKNVLDVFSKIIKYFNFAIFHDRLPVPEIEEIKSLVRVPGIKRIKILNNRVTLLLKPHLTDTQKHGAIGAVVGLLKNAFGNSANISINEARHLTLNERVKVAGDVALEDIQPFKGKVKIATLNSTEAKIAINNDLHTFELWMQSRLDAENLANKQKIAQMHKLEKTLQKSEYYNADHRSLDKDADKSLRDTFNEFRSLHKSFENGDFNKKTLADVKRAYDKYIKDALKSGTIAEEPGLTNTQYETHQEQFPVLHIAVHGAKIGKDDPKNYAKHLRDFEEACDLLNLDYAGRIELKKIYFKS